MIYLLVLMTASVFGVNRIFPSQTLGLTTANFSKTCKNYWNEFIVHAKWVFFFKNINTWLILKHLHFANMLFTSTCSSSVSVLWPLTCDLEVRWGRKVSLTVTWPADKATSWRAKSLSAGCLRLLCNGKEICMIQSVLHAHAYSLKSNLSIFLLQVNNSYLILHDEIGSHLILKFLLKCQTNYSWKDALWHIFKFSPILSKWWLFHFPLNGIPKIDW